MGRTDRAAVTLAGSLERLVGSRTQRTLWLRGMLPASMAGVVCLFWVASAAAQSLPPAWVCGPDTQWCTNICSLDPPCDVSCLVESGYPSDGLVCASLGGSCNSAITCQSCSALGGVSCAESCPVGSVSLGRSADCGFRNCCSTSSCTSTGCPAGSCELQTDNCGSSIWCGRCCPNGTCNADKGENCGTCLQDCPCPSGQHCSVINCVPDSPCGNDTCEPGIGENCGNCEDCACSGDKICQNGICVPHCGDDTCDASIGEHCSNCSQDCGNCQQCTADTVLGSCDQGEAVLCAGYCGSCHCNAGTTILSQECPSCPVAPTCASLGGSLCGSGLTCPQDYEDVGLSSDCSPQPCCKGIGPSCGELGGDRCTDTGVCPSGSDSLGRTYDCNPCCKSQPLPSCSALGGDSCGSSGVCPAGYDTLGASSDCGSNPCCKLRPSCDDDACDASIGEHCSNCPQDCGNCQQCTVDTFLGSCDQGEAALCAGYCGSCHCNAGTTIFSQECPPCPVSPTCAGLGGNVCGSGLTCPPGSENVGLSSDCSPNPCCKTAPPPTCVEMGGSRCGEYGQCPTGFAIVEGGVAADCPAHNPCCKPQELCGNGSCDVESGEHCGTCPRDCGTCLGLCSPDTIVGACDDPLACSRYCGSCHCMAGTTPQPIQCTVCNTPCDALGGDICGQGDNCPDGGVNLGVSYDCNYNACCQTISPHNCNAVDPGFVCGTDGKCPTGFVRWGAAHDCDPCCEPVCNNSESCDAIGENCETCPQECPCPDSPGCHDDLCIMGMDIKSCQTACTETQATCATRCNPEPDGPYDIITCQDYRTQYPEQLNVCCSMGVCSDADHQAAIFCTRRGGVDSTSCDPEQNTTATLNCKNGAHCTVTCHGTRQQISSTCGFYCGDNFCEPPETCANCERDCGICPSDENGLHVLTYNINMLVPPADCCGGIICELREIFGPASCHYNDLRVPLIARNAYLKNHDVIVFQEAFDDDARADLIAWLTPQYPWHTRVLDGHNPIWPLKFANGGVVILSKWPIVQERSIIYDECGVGVFPSADCFAAKGVKEAVIEKRGRYHRIFGTHTQAGGQDVHDYWDVRQAQFYEMEPFEREPDNYYWSPGPVLMAGDMNVDRNHPIVPGTDLYESFNEYEMMLAILYGAQPPIVCRSSVPNCHNTNAKGNWFDYVLYHDNRESSILPISSANSVLWVQDNDAPPAVDGGHCYYPNLSDHHPVFGNFEFDGLDGSSMAAVAATAASQAAPPLDCGSLVGLAAPTPIGPSGTVNSDVQTFSWQEVPGADSYHLAVNEVASGASIRNVTIRETSFTPHPFAVSGRQYVWTVRAVRASEQGPACEDRHFTYEESDLPAPLALAPVGAVDGDAPAFAWGEALGAEYYVLGVVDSATGDLVAGDLVPPGSPIVMRASLVPGREYRWTIRAGRGTKLGPKSEELVFTCNSASGVGAPKPIGPMGDVEGGQPTFSWNDVAGADSYQLQVVDNQTGARVLDETVAGTTLTPAAPLPTGSRYRWQVRALKAGVGGPNSLIMAFRCLAPNRPPSVVLSGCQECQIPCSVKLTAEASDPDVDGLTYEWSGCASGGGASATCTLTAAGPAVAAVTVRDGRGGEASAEAAVMGTAPPVVSVTASQATCHPPSSTAPCTAICTAAASSPEGSPLAYAWTGCASGTAPSATCVVNDLSAHTCQVTVTDDSGGTASAEASVTGTNQAPVVSVVGGEACQPPCTVTFSAEATDLDGDALVYSWSGCASGTGATATCQARGIGPLTASVSVSDPWSAAAQASKTVQIDQAPRPPQVTLSTGGSCHPASPTVPCYVLFTATAQDYDTLTWGGCCAGSSGTSGQCNVATIGTQTCTVEAVGPGGSAQASGTAQGLNNTPVLTLDRSSLPGELDCNSEYTFMWTITDDSAGTKGCGVAQVAGQCTLVSSSCGPNCDGSGYMGPQVCVSVQTLGGSALCYVNGVWWKDSFGTKGTKNLAVGVAACP